MIFRKVHFHTRIDVPIVCAIFFHFIGNVFECFSHAVFDHLLFCLFGFFEFFDHNRNNFLIYLMLILRVIFKNL